MIAKRSENKVVRLYNYDKHKRCTCTLYMTESCNLNCIYCYEHIKGRAIMPLDMAQRGIRQTFERALAEGIDYVEILFHGGEPFMAYHRIREICEWLWQQKWPVQYICYATTNGTLIQGEIKEWLLENKRRFCVGLSLDGTREMHNRNRSNSYDKLDIPFFRDNWPDQGVKMTPSPDTIQTLSDGVIHIHELGFKRNNCSFATGIDWEHDEDGNPVNYQRILQEQFMKLAQYYLDHPDIVPVDMLNMRFIAVAAGVQGMTDKLCGAGTIMRCWTPDGQCLPCHLFYEVSKERGERLGEFDLSSPQMLQDERCCGCILESVCPTCYGGNYITYGDVSRRDPYTCEITKLRALASSWMIGQMLEDPLKYAALGCFNEDELAMTTRGVLMTQQYLERIGLMEAYPQANG